MMYLEGCWNGWYGTEISYRHFMSFDFTAEDSFDEVDAHDNGIAHVRTESSMCTY